MAIKDSQHLMKIKWDKMEFMVSSRIIVSNKIIASKGNRSRCRNKAISRIRALFHNKMVVLTQKMCLLKSDKE